MMCDFDVSEINDTTEFNRDIEIPDASDIESSIPDEIEADGILATDELDDGVYHATRMSEEEVSKIDELWDEMRKTEFDVKPYRATRLSDMEQVELKEPYKATRFSDSSDMSSALSEQEDVVGVDMASSLEEQFAADVESMSFDDLCTEQARLDLLSQMDSDMDIFAEYDDAQKSKYDPELFTALTDGLPREALEYLKEGLAAGDIDVYEYFGLNGEEHNGNDVPPTRSRRQ